MKRLALFVLFFTIVLLIFWACTDRKKPVSQNNQEADNEKPSRVPFHPAFTYDSFPAILYNGKLAAPDFSTVPFGGEKDFREHLLNGLAGKGINFAGQFTIVESSCGTMCSAIYIIDRKTGRIFFDLPVNDGGRWGYQYKPTSSLLIANAEILNDSLNSYSARWDLLPELYKWDGEKLRLLDSIAPLSLMNR